MSTASMQNPNPLLSGDRPDILLSIENLCVQYRSSEEVPSVNAVNGLSFDLRKGEVLGLVGETGAGKTTTALSILKLLPRDVGMITGGKIFFDGLDVTTAPEDVMRSIRGDQISMIFQDPMTSLNPVLTVGEQIGEVLLLHTTMSEKEIASRTEEMLRMVGIPPERGRDYPHQFSGGMKQRVIIAMALACNPALLIADEPTTALDVTIQAQVLNMMKELRRRLRTAMLLITHDLGIVVQMCDRVAILYAGQIVESGNVYDIFSNRRRHHPYTEGLFGAIPSLTLDTPRLRSIEGLMPDPMNLPRGCAFHPRCVARLPRCEIEVPPVAIEGEHRVMCHLYHPNETGRNQ